ncbi:hypothetical protein [Wenxinia saemankumensis]|uniref:DUF2946 domain-containing protein n=1 Tax=Wenxinia saemankumensis TaxID=1447782 RepID=A0A1M6G477_9RHOB|nr:hypothetical protein [Wenxinia saemankumensis]SHJ04786.1 hypothetical protein SAMN05444417_2674 [Wenxinia saemankumensis]
MRRARSVPKAARLLHLLAALPFVLASLVASGTMVSAGGQGPVFTLCTGTQVVEMRLAPDGTAVPVEDAACPWLAHAHPFMAAGAPVIDPAPRDVVMVFVPGIAPAATPGTTRGWAEARGPPGAG